MNDVIVVGAGPVGLVAALLLVRGGARVALLERRDGLNTASRASTFHPPTLEILDALGVLAPVLPQGVVVRTIQYRSTGAVFAEFDMSLLADETRFPFRLHLEQALVTPHLLAALPGVRLGAEVVDVTQDADGITAHLAGGETVQGRFMLVADGARSRVRAALGVGFDGIEYPARNLRLMTEAAQPGLAPITYVHHGGHSLSYLQMPDHWRIILRVPPEVTDAEAADPAWIAARFQAVLPGTALPPLSGTDVYQASRRIASTVRVGRATIIGDAAHVTNTRGGMNMNCGVHDAAALAPALLRALDGDTDAVDRAAEERARVARDMLLPRTDRTVNGGAEWIERITATARDPDKARAYLRTAAMLDMVL